MYVQLIKSFAIFGEKNVCRQMNLEYIDTYILMIVKQKNSASFNQQFICLGCSSKAALLELISNTSSQSQSEGDLEQFLCKNG